MRTKEADVSEMTRCRISVVTKSCLGPKERHQLPKETGITKKYLAQNVSQSFTVSQ